MKKSTYEVVKMAVLAGIEYRNALHDLEHAQVCVNAVAEPRSKKTEDVVSAARTNLTRYFESKLARAEATTQAAITKAKIDTLLWFVSEDEYIEDADI